MEVIPFGRGSGRVSGDRWKAGPASGGRRDPWRPRGWPCEGLGGRSKRLPAPKRGAGAWGYEAGEQNGEPCGVGGENDVAEWVRRRLSATCTRERPEGEVVAEAEDLFGMPRVGWIAAGTKMAGAIGRAAAAG